MSSFAPFDPAMMSGRVALVTGAGGGIGGAVARRFAQLGMRLAIADLREEPVRRLAAELGGEHLAWAGDLADEGNAAALFAGIMERFGRIDAAVNTAGILDATPFEQLTKAEWDRIMDANLGSAFLVCRHCCEPMRRQGSGRIVNFSSLAGQTGGILAGAHYSAAKAGVISLTRSVAKLLAPHGAGCNAIAPGAVETDMLRQWKPEQQQHLLAGEEVAELVLWLCSPASDYITGQTININGGTYLG
jgi:NAD(P)-dependent dehydrogenase (short-subunit alcohol dehydrogenase family)